jgi:hypothetical protein
MAASRATEAKAAGKETTSHDACAPYTELTGRIKRPMMTFTIRSAVDIETWQIATSVWS